MNITFKQYSSNDEFIQKWFHTVYTTIFLPAKMILKMSFDFYTIKDFILQTVKYKFFYTTIASFFFFISIQNMSIIQNIQYKIISVQEIEGGFEIFWRIFWIQEDCHCTLYYYEINVHLWFGMFLFTIKAWKTYTQEKKILS